jgi:cell division transport system permease protein
MARLRTIVGEALRSLGANMSTTLAAAVTVLIGMFLLGLFIALWTWANSYDKQLKGQLKVRVYFCTLDTQGCNADATKAQEAAVYNRMNGDPRVSSVRFISKKEAYDIMKKRRPHDVAVLPSNPFPDEIEVTPRRGELAPIIGRELRAANIPGVAPNDPDQPGVDWGGKLTKHVLYVTHIIESFFVAAAVLLILASTLLIANTIRLSIFSRRREIEVMKLVGATNWFVRGPFMLEGLLCGLIGAIGAIVLLVLGKEIVLPSLGTVQTNSDVKAIQFSLNALLLVGVGLALGAAGSGLTIRRFLRI